MTIQTTTDLQEVVEAVVREHRDERGPLLVVLQDIQRRMGHLDPDVVPLVASALNLSRADVHGVVTFYHDFHEAPRGAVTIKLCRAEACQSMGAEAVVAEVKDLLGIGIAETAADGSVSLDQVFCLGNCALGPAAQINGRLYGRVDRDTILDVLRSDLQGETLSEAP
ncbi:MULTISPECIES: NADH-quinone oxidoreductase subunit NuoE family protein [Nocardioides]|uniref:NADH-quinone oxidoreductase subunit NuoE family protein n=1 Tax=Nocardioides TaxID=1839 RepID=UPI00032DAB00|nr:MULTISPECIES: NAD(P)H-dependent oxidoreductase subunit E [Nocardioides]EON24491.1 NADH dehydrogenase subunit E [Nocardioides sp. CF8]